MKKVNVIFWGIVASCVLYIAIWVALDTISTIIADKVESRKEVMKVPKDGTPIEVAVFFIEEARVEIWVVADSTQKDEIIFIKDKENEDTRAN
jgi:hypothetical protein